MTGFFSQIQQLYRAVSPTHAGISMHELGCGGGYFVLRGDTHPSIYGRSLPNTRLSPFWGRGFAHSHWPYFRFYQKRGELFVAFLDVKFAQLREGDLWGEIQTNIEMQTAFADRHFRPS